MNDKALVLMYYGFPADIEGMHDYLKDILHGREPPESLINENINKLKAIGGKTPSIDIVNSIRNKLENKLSEDGFNVYLLTKHYKPSIKDASSIVKENVVYEVPLFPFYSRQIFDDYFVPFENSLGKREFHRVVNIGLHNNIINYFKARLPDDSFIGFSAHSIPIRGYDPYPKFIWLGVSSILKGRNMIFYHSQGPYSPRWLGPDMDYVLKYLQKNTIDKISVIPIGFLYEHLEVLYDLDHIFRKKLETEGIQYWRAPTPNDDDSIIDAIIDIINE